MVWNETQEQVAQSKYLLSELSNLYAVELSSVLRSAKWELAQLLPLDSNGWAKNYSIHTTPMLAMLILCTLHTCDLEWVYLAKDPLINQISIAPISLAQSGFMAWHPNQCSTAKWMWQFYSITGPLGGQVKEMCLDIFPGRLWVNMAIFNF